MIFLEGGNMDGLVIVIILIMLLPSFILGLIGTILYFNEKKRAAKILFIIAVVYAIISLGICGTTMML